MWLDSLWLINATHVLKYIQPESAKLKNEVKGRQKTAWHATRTGFIWWGSKTSQIQAIAVIVAQGQGRFSVTAHAAALAWLF
jgi:hypothetical protein